MASLSLREKSSKSSPFRSSQQMPGPATPGGRSGMEPIIPGLELKRVIGTTCTLPSGFDAVKSSFAYSAGGAVVVVDVDGQSYNQRFFRARPTAVPIYNPPSLSSSTNNSTPRANDSRNRASLSGKDAIEDSAASKTWTSRERIKAATCVSLSKNGRFLAVGETGYMPRVLIFSLEDSSSNTPLVSISEHYHGVSAVAWSDDTKFLASIGEANDGFLYVWGINPQTGAARGFQQNKCTSGIRGMIWMGHSLVTFGVRHIKAWRIDETQATSKNYGGEKSLPGRNVLLGSLLESTFSCAATIDSKRAIICSETGDICLLVDEPAKDETSRQQTKMTKILEVGFATACVQVKDQVVYIGGSSGKSATLDLTKFCDSDADCILQKSESSSQTGLRALGFLDNNLVTIDTKQTIDMWNSSYIPGVESTKTSHTQIPGHGCDTILGVERLPQPNETGASFYTWSKSGHVLLWDLDGTLKGSFTIALEGLSVDGEANELQVVKVISGARFFITGDKSGVLKMVEFATKTCVFNTQAHGQEIVSLTVYEDDSRCLIASSARDRTAQLFHRTSSGEFKHFQTLTCRVKHILIPSSDMIITSSTDRKVVIHSLITKEDDPDAMAALEGRTIQVKSGVVSVTMSSDNKTLFVSGMDRQIFEFDIQTGQNVRNFKSDGQGAGESGLIDSLIHCPATDREPAFLLSTSNTDKSIRVYDTRGRFLDREWGHTEAINGVALFDEGVDIRVVSVGSDGTIMMWSLDLEKKYPRDASGREGLPPLRRVLSKAEIAGFQSVQSSSSRPPSSSGRRSPPTQTLKTRGSIRNLSPNVVKTPISSPVSMVADSTPSRAVDSTPSRCRRPSTASPPTSPQASRRPSEPNLSKYRTTSSPSLRTFGTVNMAAEQTCRTLRALRRKLMTSGETVDPEAIAELDRELRLTSMALGNKAKKRQMIDAMIREVLDKHPERMMQILEADAGKVVKNGRPGSSSSGSS